MQKRKEQAKTYLLGSWKKIKTFLKSDKTKKWFFLFLKVSVICFLLGIIFTVGVYAYFSRDLPSPGHISERRMAESTKIFDRTGDVLLYELHGEERRTILNSLDEISDNLVNATLVAEDDNFYNHHGLDFPGIAKALWTDITKGEAVRGASTLTQQLIKNAVLTSEKTYTRKIKEAILSLELERRFSKDEILLMYLNQIPYGSNAYGIEAAAETYFEKDAKDLTIDEAAMLASLPKAPTAFSPYGNNTDRLKERQSWIIKRLKEKEYITNEEAEQALKEDTLKKVKRFKAEINAPHFVMYVKQQLVEQYNIEEELIENGGLRIYTTLDWEMQQIAEEKLKKHVETNRTKWSANNAALVAISPKSGDILAMVGSYDYFDKENDGNVNVAIRGNQPGSSFKPFAYATAFAKGYSPKTILYDAKTNFKENEYSQDYKPQNYDGGERGPVSMKEALATSLNIPAVKTLYLAGIDDTLETAKAMGITTLTQREEYGLALVLGAGSVTLLEETSAFGVFANDGIKQNNKSILRIEDSEGKIIRETVNDPGQRVLASQVARQINDCLSDNDARSKVFGRNSALYISGKKIAAKTGTTQEYRDAWTVGYTPELVVGVWVGNNYNEPMKNGAGGIAAAAPLWNDFMSQFVDQYSKIKFEKPKEEEIKKPMLGGKLEDEIELEIDKKSGLIASDDCKDKYTKKRTFRPSHTILYYVDRENPHGPPPDDPEDDPQFENWEKGVKKWADKNDIRAEIPDPDKRACKGDDDDDDD